MLSSTIFRLAVALLFVAVMAGIGLMERLERLVASFLAKPIFLTAERVLVRQRPRTREVSADSIEGPASRLRDPVLATGHEGSW